jgi:two-component system NtrC family sensor kinase
MEMKPKSDIAHTIIEALQDGIYIINQDYVVEYMNRAMIKIFGNGVGRKCHRLINLSEERCPWCQAEQVFTGRTVRKEINIPRIDCWFEAIDMPFTHPDGRISKLSIYRDITQRLKRERALEDSRRDYENLFERVGCGVYISSREGKFLNANQTLVEMLGYGSKEEFLGMDIINDLYCRPEDRRRFQKMVERDGRVIDYEVEVKRKDGSPLTVLLTSHVRCDAPGNVIGYEGLMVDQSQRKMIENKLRASEAEYKRLFEHVACGVFISSKEGKFLDANQALLDMLGYEKKEDFLNIDIARDLYVRPEDRRKFQRMIERDGHVIDHEVEFKRKDGSVIPILLTGHVRRDERGNVIGYEGLNVDISQRKLMEKEIREAYDFLNKIVRSSANAIIATDIAGNILIWNRAAEETLGYAAEEVIGKMNIDKIYPEGTARQVMQRLRSTEYGGTGRLNAYPMVYVRRDGTVVEGSLSAAIIYGAAGKEVASVGSFVDMTERLEMERALRNTQEQLLQSEKLAAMGRLTSQIAHELNNPLYGIMNTLELLKTEIAPENKRRKILDMALSETSRLSELLRKMLSFSKPDQEQRSLVDINSVIDEILLLNSKQLQENDISLSTELDEHLPPVSASKNQLRQVFLNMIANARDAMPEGGVFAVKTYGDPENVYIELSDSGTGIRKEHLDKIFDSFFTTKDSVKGVGLGLSVCYGFIQDHGGDIHVKSAPGEGTCFTINLPVAKSAPAAESNAT